MLNSKGFDLWADNYDKSVNLSNKEGRYPFAGYKIILNEIYNSISLEKGKVLDMGFGTSILTEAFYNKGYEIYGQDFSSEMIKIAQKKMPNAKLYIGDFSNGIVEELKKEKYDVIIAIYSLHHLTTSQKIELINQFLSLLVENGKIYIGDIVFRNFEDLEKCRILEGENWDSDEIYFVYEELKKTFPMIKFKKISYCSGIFTLEK